MTNVLLVTGGSRGIGAAIARLGGRRGYDVCVNYASTSERAEEVAQEIRRSGQRVMTFRADTSVETDVISMFEELDRTLGPVRAVVNNAAITGGFGRVDELDAALLRRVMDVNVIGCFLVARESVKRMSTRHGGAGGAIVNVSSSASFTGSPGEYVHYAASKGALDSMTIGLAREVASEGIRVNAVNPAIIDTEIHAAGGLPDRFRDKGRQLPIGRGGTPEEVAHAVMWLLSKESSFTTGACLPLTGGL